MSRDQASNQLINFKNSHQPNAHKAVTASGIPVPSLTNSLTVGKRGNVGLTDINLTEHLAHFARERIPERFVHATGAGAFGYFEVTHDVTKYTKARVFEEVGKITPLFARFSTVNVDGNASQSVRDPRAVALKFYTDDGIWDLLSLTIDVFFVHDPKLFVSLTHSQKRNPQTHLRDNNMYWDLHSSLPETVHADLILFSDRGTPDGFRKMDTFPINTFRLVNAKDEIVYIKFRLKSQQGLKNFTAAEAAKMNAEDPDHGTRDLYNSIAKGNYPSWTMYWQIVTEEQAQKYRYNIFDATKLLPEKDFPLIPVGRYTLNRNPTDYFAEVEQVAFNPANMPPGIEPSFDRILNGRMFAYREANLHRLGSNFEQLPINRPLADPHTYLRSGHMCNFDYSNSAPNYYPNSFNGPYLDPNAEQSGYSLSGMVDRYADFGTDLDYFSQATDFYRNDLNEEQKMALIQNLADSLKQVYKDIQVRAVNNFSQVDKDLGKRLRRKIAA